MKREFTQEEQQVLLAIKKQFYGFGCRVVRQSILTFMREEDMDRADELADTGRRLGLVISYQCTPGIYERSLILHDDSLNWLQNN